MIRLRASLILKKDLIGLTGWPGMGVRDKMQRFLLKLGKNFPWTIERQMMRLKQHDVDISSRCRRKHKLSICLEE
jgi:hypothetical protein